MARSAGLSLAEALRTVELEVDADGVRRAALVVGDDVQMHLTQVRTRQIAVHQPPTSLDDEPWRPWWALWRRD